MNKNNIKTNLTLCGYWTLSLTIMGFFAYSAFGLTHNLSYAHEGDESMEEEIRHEIDQSTQQTRALGPQPNQQLSQSTQPQLTADLLPTSVEKRQQFLEHLKMELQSARRDFSAIRNTVNDAGDRLDEVQEQRTTLEVQLQSIDEQVNNTLQLLQNVLMQVQEKENELTLLGQDIEMKNTEIEHQKMLLSEYLSLLYQQENEMRLTTDESKQLNVAKLLLSEQTPGEMLQELRYFTILEETGHLIFGKLEDLVKAKEAKQTQIENVRNDLTMLYRQLEEEKRNLDIQREAKNRLLQETKGQEAIYQQMLDESAREQAQVLTDIQQLSNNLAFIQDKMAELGDKFNPDDYASVITKETTNVAQYIKDTADLAFQPKWPVTPSRGISAYFHDEAYRKVMGAVHQAVDIRALQGTPLHAAADGVVYRAKDNGYGYSYIILAHNGGFMTVYGHVLEIRVVNGQKIKQGEVIGLSGGMPGTKGAGLMTTGPHLHFEVHKGGKPVDPLDYLPLSYLPLNTLPQKYLIRVTGEQAKIRRGEQEAHYGLNDQLFNAVEQSAEAGE